MAACVSLAANCVAIALMASSCSLPAGNPVTYSAAALGSTLTQDDRTLRKAFRWDSSDGKPCTQLRAARGSFWAHRCAMLLMACWRAAPADKLMAMEPALAGSFSAQLEKIFCKALL